MNKPPVRWWNRKRWGAVAAAVLLSFAAGVPLLLGPAIYGTQRGWMSLPTYRRLSRAINPWIPTPADAAFSDYLHWWVDLGMRHDADLRLRRMKGSP